MKIACLGGGPAGLYFAISMKLRDAAHDITVFERNRPDDTFGWGVVFSDETLDNLHRQRSGQRGSDPRAFRLLGRYRRQLSRRADRFDRPRLLRHRAQEVAAVAAAARAGAGREPALSDRDRQRRRTLARTYDLVVAADGLNSKVRSEFAQAFPARRSICANASSSGSAPTRNSTTPSPSFSRRPSTAGFGRTPINSMPTPRPSSSSVRRRPGTSSASARCRRNSRLRTCERIFAKYLGGHQLMSNARHLRGSGWLNFPRVLCETWSHRNIVLMGDAAATAHFSIGSGTKLAMESAISLADYLAQRANYGSRLRQIRGCAPHRGAAPAIGGAQFARMVRGRRALSASRSGAVQLFAADAFAAHQPRKPAAARQGLAGRRRSLVPAAGRRRQTIRSRGGRCSRRSSCAT